MQNFSLAKRERYAAWREETQTAINETISSYNWYWLLDPCALPDPPEPVKALESEYTVYPLYLNTYHEKAMLSGPILIPYVTQDAFVDWLFEIMETFPVGYLVQVSQGNDDELYEHLQNQIECVSPNGNRSLFRFYDPRILYAVTTCTDESALKRLLGPITHAHCWEHGRRAAIKAGDGTDHLYRCPGDIHYSDQFMEHIWKEVKIHTLIQLYGGAFASSHPDISFFEMYDLLEKTYLFLAENGFADMESFCLASAFTAAFPNCIWEEEFVIQAFSELPEKTTFADALGAIGEGRHG